MNATPEHNGSIPFRRAQSLFAAGAAALLLAATCGCGNGNVSGKDGSNGNQADRKRDVVNSPEEARLKLAQLSVEYSPTQFVLHAAKGDTTVIKLFIEAGIDVNSSMSAQELRSVLLEAVKKTRRFSGRVSFEDFGSVTALEAALLGSGGKGANLLLNHKANVGRESLAAAAFLGNKALLGAVVTEWRSQPEAAKYDWTKEGTTGFAALASPEPEAANTLVNVGYDAPSMLRLATANCQFNTIELLLKGGGLSGSQVQDEIAYLDGYLEKLLKHAKAIADIDGTPNTFPADIKEELDLIKAELVLLKAENGDAQSQGQLGYAFLVGSLGVAKDEVEALKWYRKAAEQGNAHAQWDLGLCYASGQGVAKDEVEAVKWYRKAAEQEDAEAQWRLGLCYARGQGVAKDEVEAVRWYRKAAEQGNAHAQWVLGLCYASGQGLAKDQVEAGNWYRKAAEQGDAEAQWRLGLCYASGQGVARDDVEAVRWYRKAAEQNLAAAQVSLWEFYAKGHGAAKDEVEGAKWFQKAAESKDANDLNALAWVLATRENSAIRDGSKAVVFAERAVFAAEMFPKKYEKHAFLDTLAVAYAEAGQFEKAVSTEQEAIGLLPTEEYKNDYKARLKLFEAKSPYRAQE